MNRGYNVFPSMGINKLAVHRRPDARGQSSSCMHAIPAPRYGYMGEYAVERLWRDAKLLEIGGGTLESHQKNMARELRGWTP